MDAVHPPKVADEGIGVGQTGQESRPSTTLIFAPLVLNLAPRPLVPSKLGNLRSHPPAGLLLFPVPCFYALLYSFTFHFLTVFLFTAHCSLFTVTCLSASPPFTMASITQVEFECPLPLPTYDLKIPSHFRGVRAEHDAACILRSGAVPSRRTCQPLRRRHGGRHHRPRQRPDHLALRLRTGHQGN